MTIVVNASFTTKYKGEEEEEDENENKSKQHGVETEICLHECII